MRTTLTLDDDVAAQISARQAEDVAVSFKELVNGLLRTALTAKLHRKPCAAYSAPVVRGARLRIPADIRSTQEMLELAEGDWCR